MGLNNIQLPAQTIVDLYKNLLCEDNLPLPAVKLNEPLVENDKTVTHETKTSPVATGQINFLGKNLRQLSILVDYDNEVYLPEKQLNFISSILTACKMNLADVAIVNINKQQVAIEELIQQLNPKYLVVFGFDANRINFRKPLTLFNILSHGDMQVFNSTSLEQLNQDGEEGKLLKSKLWLCMKNMLTF